MISVMLLITWLIICAGAICGTTFVFGYFIKKDESLLIPSIFVIFIYFVLGLIK